MKESFEPGRGRMKTGKKRNITPRARRLMFYLSLLAAAVFFAVQEPGQLWLAIGLSVGLLYAVASDWISGRKKKTEAPAQFSTETEETVENKSAFPAGEDPQNTEPGE